MSQDAIEMLKADPAFKDADGRSHDKRYFEAREAHRAVENLVFRKPARLHVPPFSSAAADHLRSHEHGYALRE